MKEQVNWHALNPSDTAELLASDLKEGLAPDEAARRLSEHGPNELRKAERRGPFRIFLSQFADIMILILVIAAVISGAMGEVTDTVAIIVIVLLNAGIGAVQEVRAEKAMLSLRELAAPFAVVRRGGKDIRLRAREIVPGDIVLLEAGEIVPADLRLVDAHSIKAGEAALTGESGHVQKSSKVLLDAEAALADRINMVFKGTVIGSGRGAGIVVATGMDTEFGRIAALIEEKEEKTPLQKRLSVFSTRLSWLVLAIAAIIFAGGLLRGEEPVLMFMTAVSLAVAAIPEALPAVITITLAIGAAKMVEKKALARRLSAVETLGSVTFICTDKTGTLTMNRMTVTGAEVVPGTGNMLYRCMALNTDARMKDGAAVGDPTEAALVEFAAKGGFHREMLEVEYPRAGELPFDAERKLMSTLHRSPDGRWMVVAKGAFESVTAIAPGTKAFAPDAEKAAREGLRVIAYCWKEMDSRPPVLEAEEAAGGFTFAGYAMLMDPIRPEAFDAVAECNAAGIRTVMITGDHPATAARIALDVGIKSGADGLMTGRALAEMPQAEFAKAVENIGVYARVVPEQKYRIVQALQAKGHFVAMTGDGVNDAPALKKADIGVAMGVVGTEAAREASDMVLLDDNFASIVRAVREGRRIYSNIRKFIRYVVGSNVGEVATLFLAPFFGLPLPLLPVQLLWINLVTDGLPGLCLAIEKEEPDIMRRPPRPPSEGLLSQGVGWHILWVGLLIGALSIWVQAWAWSGGRSGWQSMVFTVLCFAQMGHVLAVRSETRPLWSIGLFSNVPMLLSVLLTVVLQLLILYVPWLNGVFKTQPLSAFEMTICIGLSAVVFFAVEGVKIITRKRLEA